MTDYEIEARDLAEQDTGVAFATLPIAEIAPWLGKAFADVADCLARKGAGPVGMPFARYHSRADGRFDVEAGFVASTPTSGEGEVEPSELPAGPAAVTTHTGPYEAIAPAYEALIAWIRERGGEPVGDPWEVYLNSPATVAPASLETEVVMPYRLT
jgi:effector-binding domain-containing protein